MSAATAYHEAGHAVVSYRLGFYSGPASIVPDDCVQGSSIGEAEWADGSQDVDYITVLYAGRAAALRFDPATGNEGCGADDAQADELLACHSGLTEAQLRARADDLVTRHWAEIDAVASVLIEEGTLQAEDIDFICDAVLECRERWREMLFHYRRCVAQFTE